MSRAIAVIAIWFAGLACAGQYAKVSVIFERLGDIFPQSPTVLGFAVSLVGFVGIVFGAIAGLLVAQIGARRALLWGLWSGAVIAGLEALLPPLPILLGLRVAEGISHLAIVVAAPVLIAALTAERHMGIAMTLWSTFFSVGFAATVYLGLPLADARGVGALLTAHAVWMGLAAVLLTAILPRLPEAPAPFDPRSLLTVHLRIYGAANQCQPALGWAAYTFCFLAILTVLPPYIDEDWRLFILGAMPLLGIAVSMTLGVFMLRFLPAVHVMQTGFALVIACLVWLVLAPGLPAACLALAASFGLVQGAGFASVAQLNKTKEGQSLAFGALAQMGNLGNTTGTPLLLAMATLTSYAGMIWMAVAIFCLIFVVFTIMNARRALHSA